MTDFRRKTRTTSQHVASCTSPVHAPHAFSIFDIYHSSLVIYIYSTWSRTVLAFPSLFLLYSSRWPLLLPLFCCFSSSLLYCPRLSLVSPLLPFCSLALFLALPDSALPSPLTLLHGRTWCSSFALSALILPFTNHNHV